MALKFEPDWYRIKFLESTSNIKRALKESIGREPSTRIAREISACLQQGRMFFEAAIQSPIEIRPLLIFYGIIGFSKAVILAKHQKGHETLLKSHGLKDISSENARIENLKLKIEENGTFHQFSDVIVMLEGVNYNLSSMPLYHKIPFDSSANIISKEIIFKDILARIPGLGEYFQSTFREYPKNKVINLHYMGDRDGLTRLQITDPEIYKDRISLERIVQKWRTKYSFLENWCFIEGVHAWGESYLTFGNINKSEINEFSEEFLIERDGRFETKSGAYNLPYERIDFKTILPPLSGGLTKSAEHMIEDYGGAFISEYALHYLGMFLLSSLVRYRPQIWSHAIKAWVTREKPADDKALALIEKFMDLTINEFPDMAVKAMTIN
jgi:hypothetical protein